MSTVSIKRDYEFSFEEIGIAIGVSRQRAEIICKKALKKIEKIIKENRLELSTELVDKLNKVQNEPVQEIIERRITIFQKIRKGKKIIEVEKQIDEKDLSKEIKEAGSLQMSLFNFMNSNNLMAS